MTTMNQKDEKSHFLLFRILQCHLMVVRILKILCLKRPLEVCSLISKSPPLEQEMVTGAFSNLFFYNSREGGAGGRGSSQQCSCLAAKILTLIAQKNICCMKIMSFLRKREEHRISASLHALSVTE